MKLSQIFLLSFTLSFTAAFSQTGWQTVTLPSTVGSTYKVNFLNSSTGYLYANAIYKTTNEGANWQQLTTSLSSGMWARLCFASANTGIIIAGGVYRTTNGGTNWESKSPPPFLGSYADITFINSTTGWLSDAGRVYKTIDAGATFANYVLVDSGNVLAMVARLKFFNENNGIFVGLFGINHTTNGGLNWTTTRSYTGIRASYGDFFDENNGIIVANTNTIGKNAARTTNGGINWTYFSIGTDSLYNIKFLNQTTGWAAGAKGSLYKTTDAGLNWTKYNGINTTYTIRDISFINETTGYLTTQKNILLKTTDGGTVFIAQTSTEVPDKISLSQNYPNPFNPSTTINYSLKSAGYTSLTVFDSQGKEVETLVNEKQTPGSYAATFNADNLPSGAYYYKLISGNFSETKKMILIK